MAVKPEQTWNCHGFLGYKDGRNGQLRIEIPPDIPGQKRKRKRALKLVSFLENHPKCKKK